MTNKNNLAENNNKKKSVETGYVFVKINRTFQKIATSDIHYVQAMADYVRIVTPEKVYTAYSTMKAMQSKLPGTDFVRVHRSYIVRLESITQFQEGFLNIQQRLIPIGKVYKDQLLERLPIL